MILAEAFAQSWFQFLRTPFLQNTSGRLLLYELISQENKESGLFQPVQMNKYHNVKLIEKT